VVKCKYDCVEDKNGNYPADNKEYREEISTVECENCGSKQFYINWLNYPYTGGYLKLTCIDCGEFSIISG
jgi:hypothetical protein